MRTRLGHSSHQGSPALRCALVDAAQHPARGSGPLRQTYERIAKRLGKQIAKVAVAHKILRLRFYGLRMTRPADHVPPSLTASDHSSELACCQWPLPRP
jgi:hypothetical protein